MTISELLLMMLVILGTAMLLTVWFLWLLIRRVERRIENDLLEALEQARPRAIGLEVEELQGIFYCYNSDSKEFICQGSTVDELQAGFRSRFPHHTAYIVQAEQSVLDMIKRHKLSKDTHEASDSQ